MTVHRKEDRRCATCAWWPGRREPRYIGSKLYGVTASDDRDVCPVAHARYSASGACSRWQLWPPLRG